MTLSFVVAWLCRLRRTPQALVVASLTVGAVGSANAQPRPDVQLSPTGSRVTITVGETDRAGLLAALVERTGISVRAEELPSGRVAVNLRDVSIDSAIRVILGPSARYVVRLGDRETIDTTRATEARKRGTAEVRLPSLGAKDRTRPYRPTASDRGRIKPVADSIVRTTRPLPGLPRKPNTAERGELPEGKGPKEPPRTQVERDSSIRVSFVMRRPAEVRLVSVQRVPGIAPRVTRTRGPILFTLRNAAGRVVYVGSVLDPLEQHDPSPVDSLHGSRLMPEGPFAITLPHDLVTERTLPGLRLDFYDARLRYVPPVLDPEAFRSIASQLEQTSSFRGAELLRTLRTSTRRPR